MRFLCFDDVFAASPDIVKFRFSRVIFGATCSQFLLNGTVQKHSKKYEFIDPDFARRVRKHFYVDDLSTGVNTVDEGVDIYKKMKLRFNECSMNVTKWRTNNAELRNFIHKSEGIEFGNEKLENEKVLGLQWNEKGDTFVLNVVELFNSAVTIKPTKRNILKVIASVYDPVGYLQSVIIKLKLLFQEICILSIKWDDHIGKLESKWNNIVENLREFTEIQVNRCYYINSVNDPVDKIYLHGFSDASELAYGACVFIKSVKRSGDVSINLVTSKSRVVPLKKSYSIPRLELLGNFILAKLIMVTFNSLTEEIVIDDYFCWSDSMITLAWIKSDQEFKPFVENRVRSIRRDVMVEKWNYCKSIDNPADIITRFNSCRLNKNNMWWRGPEFLKNSIEYSLLSDKKLSKKSEEELLDETQYNEEVRKVNCLAQEVNVLWNLDNIITIERYSDFNKLIRVTSWVLRVVNNLKSKIRKNNECSGDLSNVELQKAKLYWIKSNQDLLRNEKDYFQIVNSLNLYEDTDGVIRSKGRIDNSNLPYETRLPIMLSRNHKLSELLVSNYHRNVKHNGVRQTLAEFRSQFWVTQGKSFVKKILNRCVVCKRFNTRPYNYPKAPDLPNERVSNEVPFSFTGVDYLGPIYCKNVYDVNSTEDEDMHKAFIALYTCASTRGVILDLVHNAEAKTFIDSFVRFISRRGCPKTILSDNGTVFTANSTQRFAAERNITWKFSVEDAPWNGGFWERLVGCVKRCLKKPLERPVFRSLKYKQHCMK